MSLVEAAAEQLQKAKAKRKELPKHIEIKELPEEQRFAQLAPVGKQLVDFSPEVRMSEFMEF